MSKFLAISGFVAGAVIAGLLYDFSMQDSDFQVYLNMALYAIAMGCTGFAVGGWLALKA